MKCRFCGNDLSVEFIDLVNAPPSNSFLNKDELNQPESYFPLKLFVCDRCFLVQIDEYCRHSEIFNSSYAYFSSYSTTWLEHCKKYADDITKRLDLNSKSKVVEIASNDGYLLQYFKDKNIDVLGVEPTASTAEVARRKGIETVEEFFTSTYALQLIRGGTMADLVIGNNVLAHVPDINDFVSGLKLILKPDGLITMEFPHLLQLIANNQFDTIYHEHFSYFSFLTVQHIFGSHGLKIIDVEELHTHGGSLRIYAGHKSEKQLSVSERVQDLLKKEIEYGMNRIDYYQGFQQQADKLKYDLLKLLIELKSSGKSIAAYGAAAKGNTLLNYCGIKKDLIDFVVDASPFKQGKFLPGSHIPVVEEIMIKEKKPDYIIVFPWNIKKEIMTQLAYIKDWQGKFIIPIPTVEVI